MIERQTEYESEIKLKKAITLSFFASISFNKKPDANYKRLILRKALESDTESEENDSKEKELLVENDEENEEVEIDEYANSVIKW